MEGGSNLEPSPFWSVLVLRHEVLLLQEAFGESSDDEGEAFCRNEFFNASVPVSTQATFPYKFAVSKFLQPGSFDLVGTIVYEVYQQQYQSVFYNGTIKVAEAGGFVSIESVFLFTLGVAVIALVGLWPYGLIHQFSNEAILIP